MTATKREGRAVPRRSAAQALREYESKRDFRVTPEPPASSRTEKETASQAAQFVVQKHDARRLHYDFRLELDGALKSWAIPKGPSLDPHVKRLAVHVEDHPLAYATFEGHIPEGEYGGGDVIVWDRGEWQPEAGDPQTAYRAGKLKFQLFGEKLSGGWTLVRTRLPGSGDKEQWLLIKEDDAAARPEAEYDIVAARPESVLSQPEPSKKTGRKPSTSASRPAGERIVNAKRASLPAQLSPALATLVDEPPAGDWRYEIKFDGYRLLARIDGAEVQLFTRNGLDWTGKLEALAAAVHQLGLESGWLDGEIVVFDKHGLPDFQGLQNAFEGGRTGDIIYFLFDLPYCNGLDLRGTPLEQRRTLLRSLLGAAESTPLRYSEDVAASRGEILRSFCEHKLEGVIGKRVGSPYVSRRTSDWIKLKCKHRQEFVIGGYTAPQGNRSNFGALLLGVHDDAGRLRYAGRVGTGFNQASLRSLHAQMQPLARQSPPFAHPPTGREAAGVTWLEPRLLCEVEFASWTRDGMVRQAVFHGLRADKPPQAIVVETAEPARQLNLRPAAGATRQKARAEIAGIEISHPDRVVDADSGITKFALAAFYRDIAPHLLPHIAGRPISLLRAPTGVGGDQFFQRHAEKLAIPGVRLLDSTLGPEGDPLMAVDNLNALIGAVQMGSIEFHTWNIDSEHFDRPDRMIFDLDPDPELPWTRMVEATHLVLALLDELGLKAFLKTSGGKGMHLVVPLARRHDWALVKAFSKGVAQHLATVLPRHFADRMGPQNRIGKIFVDYLRNQKGGSTVAAYSVRARPGLPVSVPIAREELDRLGGSAEWTVRNVADRLARLKDDPWVGYAHQQRLTQAMQERLNLA